MADTAEPCLSTQVICISTGQSKTVRLARDGSPRLPPGWKRLGDATYSKEAWSQRFVLRRVRIAVSGVECPVNSPDAQREAWSQLRAALQTSWRQATQCSNWMMTELAKADSTPLLPGDKGLRLPPFPDLAETLRHLYQGSREQWPELDSQSLCSVRQQVVAKYRQLRFDLRCRASVSLPTYRYPLPLPLPAKDVTLSAGDGRVYARVRVSGQVFVLRLRAGASFRYPLRILRAVAAGELLMGESLLSEQLVAGSRYATGRQSGSGQATQLMLTVAVWVPRHASGREMERVCSVTTGPDRLWSVRIDDLDVNAEGWTLHEDQIRRWSAAYYHQLDRLRADQRMCGRRVRSESFERRRLALKIKFRHRIHDACHKAARSLVQFCQRHKIGTVNYCDEDKTWLQVFPWHELKQLCQEKCEQATIRFNPDSRCEDSLPVSKGR